MDSKMVDSKKIIEDKQISYLYEIVVNRDLTALTEEQFCAKFEKAKDQLTSVTVALDPTSESKYKSASVIYIAPGKKATSLEMISKEMSKTENLLIFTNGKNIRQVKKKVESLCEKTINTGEKKRVDVISSKYIFFDIAVNAHTYPIYKKPSHEIAFNSTNEQIKPEEFPVLFVNDIEAIYNGLEVGDNVCVQIPTSTSGIGTINYCVEEKKAKDIENADHAIYYL